MKDKLIAALVEETPEIISLRYPRRFGVGQRIENVNNIGEMVRLGFQYQEKGILRRELLGEGGRGRTGNVDKHADAEGVRVLLEISHKIVYG